MLLRLATTMVTFTFMALLLTGCDQQEIIAHDLHEREANEILVFLSGKGIEATKIKAESGGGGGGGGAAKWNIAVSGMRKREAMAILSEAGLPRRAQQGLLDIFKDSGLVPSELQEQIKYQSGLAEEIASTIRNIDGVIDAAVKLSFPKDDPLNPQAEKGIVTASVYVKHTGILNDPNSHLIPKIRHWVAGSVPDLEYDHVTVVPDLARYRSLVTQPTDEDFKSGDKPLVSIWTVILAKESVTTFRIIFFSFVVSLLILVALLAWILWKIMPVMASYGGVMSLLSFGPLQPSSEAVSSETEGKEKEKKKKKGDKEDDEDDEDEEEDEDDDEDDEE